MIDGVINIYKEKGYTSHDVVAKMRGILKQKKIGHTGTLDPDATGVLPVCLGKGTRLCDFLTDKTKIYETVLLLGKETDTQDTSGTVLSEAVVTVTEAAVREAALSFVGEYAQIPPMYSAIKQDGKKLYELARAGKVVERKAREVFIYEIEIQEVALPRVHMRITCSKGTYIRTLCHDIGNLLGCYGCMEALKRTKTGGFAIEDSITLTELEKLRDENKLDAHIVAVDTVLSEYPKTVIKEEGVKLLYNGNALPSHCLQAGETFMSADGLRVYDLDNQFIALYQYQEQKHVFKPLKMFYGGN